MRAPLLGLVKSIYYISLNATHANMCTNLKHVVLVLANFCIYQLISAISKTLKCVNISQLTLRILTSSQISIKLQQEPYIRA